jgi:F-type H+-transporting ATPase subunit delta
MIDPVTTRYVEALFHLAKERGALDAVAADVRRLGGELSKPGVGAFFADARVSLETRRAKLEPLLAGAHELLRNLVGLLFDKRREAVLAGLGAAFHQRMLAEKGAAEGVVESARPLDRSDVERLEIELGRRLGLHLRLSNEVEPTLIGGVRVIVGAKMLDRSLRGRLEGLEKRLYAAALPSLQDA